MNDASKVIQLVAEETGVEVDRLLLSTRGSPREAHARQMVMWLLHEPPFSMNFTDIGTCLGRYRKTVSHGVERIALYKRVSSTLARQLRNVRTGLQR